MMENKASNKKKLLEVLIITLFLTYGIHYFGYFIRVRYFNLLDPLKELNPGLHSILHYLGHLVFWGVFAIYCFAVKGERKYFEAFMPGKGNNKVSKLLIGMEDTGHYHFALLKYLLDKRYTVALINPTTTDLTRKIQGGITKNDPLDSITICDVIASNQRKKPYRITTVNRFDLYEQKQLTRHHHNLKEELNIYKNRLQKCIDIVFPEFNSLFNSKYGIVYMNILKTFSSANAIANADALKKKMYIIVIKEQPLAQISKYL